MKKLYALLLVLAPFAVSGQLIENPGFEEWENITNGNPEPVSWSSIQSGEPEFLANVAPQVLFKDDIDPHSGTFNLRLKNVTVTIANVVANGIATNGRVHANFDPQLGYVFTDASDPRWNTVCNTRPDSVVGYYKYSPQGNDITMVQALLHTGTTGKIPDPNSTGWVGFALFQSPNETVGEWTRFSVPFVYTSEANPEYILFNISGGNGTNAVSGSEAWYDDIELVYNTVGIEENVANELLNVYSKDRDIIVDMRKFGAGEIFNVEVYNVTGQLILKDQVISGYTKELKVETSGIFICTLRSNDGLTLSKKVMVQ